MGSNNTEVNEDFEALHLKAENDNKSMYRDPKTGFSVLTRKFLKERGYCCNSACRHCPYNEDLTFYIDTQDRLTCTPLSAENVIRMGNYFGIQSCWCVSRSYYDVPERCLKRVSQHHRVKKISSKEFDDIIKQGF